MTATTQPALRARFITTYVELEEPRTYALACTTIVLVIALLVAAVGWSIVTPVAEIAYAPGEVMPAGLPHRIQYPHGGRIDAVAVRSGDHVEPGDLLVSLSPTSVRAEVDQILARRASLVLERERINALLYGRELQFDVAPEFQHLAAQQRVAYERQRASHRDRRRTLEHEVKQREAEARRYSDQARALTHRVSALRDKLDMLESLRETKSIAEVNWIDTRADLAQVEAEYIQVKGAAEAALSGLDISRSRVDELESELESALSLRANEVLAELAEVEQDIVALEDRLESLDIRAPIVGIVKVTELAGVNAVVGAGEVLMEIVPVADDLVVHALLTSDDIGYVKIGQDARVLLDGFDRNSYGWLDGTVSHISASTYLDDEGVPRYFARVSLARQYLGDDTRPVRIVPGMSGNVEISTGDKTVMTYLLKPILRGFQNSFHER